MAGLLLFAWDVDVTDLQVHRWQRYGHDRVYVQAADGTRIGHYDLKTRTVHSEDPDNGDLILQAVAAFITEQAPATPSPVAGEVEPIASTELSRTAPVRTLLARVLGVKTNERAWRIGADGEEAVGARLSRLGDEWHVLHAVPVGDNGSDIDHVVIGPAGVFTVNAKNHPGARIWVGGNTFMVNGQKVPYVRNSRHEANRAARLLTLATGFPVEASGVIAVIGAQGGVTIREQPTDGRVVVVTRKKIANYLSARPVVLRPEQIEAIHQAARVHDVEGGLARSELTLSRRNPAAVANADAAVPGGELARSVRWLRAMATAGAVVLALALAGCGLAAWVLHPGAPIDGELMLVAVGVGVAWSILQVGRSLLPGPPVVVLSVSEARGFHRMRLRARRVACGGGWVVIGDHDWHRRGQGRVFRGSVARIVGAMVHGRA